MTYVTRTLFTRNLSNPTNLDKHSFIGIMCEDLACVTDKYRTMVAKENDDNNFNLELTMLKKYEKQAEEKHYKRESSKKKYVATMFERWKTAQENYRKQYSDRDSGIFFDMDPSQGTKMGIPMCCILSVNSTLEDLGKCYDEIVKSDYFKKSKGWVFKYESRDTSVKYSFRPWIEPILDDETRNEIERKRNALADSINNFYSGGNYWGD